MIITYTVEGVHSWKRDKVTARGGHARTYRPEGDFAAKQAHVLACRAEFAKLYTGSPYLGGDTETVNDAKTSHVRSVVDQYAVKVVYSPANERAHDTDRVLTLVLDALTGVVWHDDSDKYVTRSACEVVRGDKRFPPGTTTVTIERVAGPYAAAKKTRAKKVAS